MTAKDDSQRRRVRAGSPRRPFSPLIGRVMAINLIALAILGGGVLYLDQFRDGLIERGLEGLMADARTIAGAIGESATSGPETTELDIEIAQQVIARLAGSTNTRARLFNLEGILIADSRLLDAGGSVSVVELPSPERSLRFDRITIDWLNGWLDRIADDPDLPPYVERPQQTAADYEEVGAALGGEDERRIRRLDESTLMLSGAVPVQRFRRVLGGLMLTKETSDIRDIIYAERMTILKVFSLAILVTLLLSFFLARTIARPIRQLARSADLVAGGIGRASAIPEFPDRQDEIGDLSQSLGKMTRALYRQIDGVELFAADVAHELKNPLSSLRSAVETIRRTDDSDVRDKLLSIVEDDVRRLDRLITDISDASRLDAELSRSQMEEVDLRAILSTLVDAYEATKQLGEVRLILNMPAGDAPVIVLGIDHRLGQVARNLIDNAISFSPAAGSVRITLRLEDGWAEIIVEDEGPGLPNGAADKIFDRFYSERPVGEAFGKHSGLGLPISKQIVEAHGGEIRARVKDIKSVDGTEDEEATTGARFVVRLPC